MIDIDNHKIVDIIESRKDSDVAAWLKTFPNLELVSRDGALCYRNAINETNKDIVQVTDRFHLLKNLTTYCKDFLLKKFNKFIYLNKTEEDLKEIETLEKYNLFIDKKIIGESKKTICKDLVITSKLYEQFEAKYIEEKPDTKIRTHELNKLQNYNKKLAIINKARTLRCENYSITQICKMLKLDYRTVKKYIDPTFNYDNSRKRISNLDPYYSFIEMNINKGINMTYIYNSIKEKGYDGSYSSLRSYCRKFKFKYNSNSISTYDDKIELKNIIKFLYHPINEIKEISIEQFDKIFRQHPIIEEIYKVIIDFKSAVFETKSVTDFKKWVNKVKVLNIPELNSFIRGLERDITAVTTAINVKYSNGLAEGTVNKIKFIKRIMYGRCKFDTLRNKILIAEKYN